MENKKIFPIKSNTACLLKWSWSTIFLGTRKTSSCHRVDQDIIEPGKFESFHNTPQKILAREQMRRGEWPKAGCQYCEKIEDAGGVSDRQYQLSSMHISVPEELETDPAANSVTPTMLEVYFTNTCNMACLYCGPEFSSTWQAENNRFGTVVSGSEFGIGLYATEEVFFNDQYESMLGEFWTWLEKNYLKLRNFQILGGEPFYQKELEMCIDFFDHHPNPNLQLNLVSNLKVEHSKFRRIIDKLQRLKSENKIKHVQITGSLDCWGEAAEYIRSGLDLKEFSANMEYMLDTDIVVCINSAINVLSIKATAEMIRQINTWNDIRYSKYKTYTNKHIYFSFMTVNWPKYMNPDIFGGELFVDDFKEIIESMPRHTEDQERFVDHMVGIAKQISSAIADQEMIGYLREYLDIIDNRRNTNWKQTFPWLEDQFRKLE